MSAGIYNVLTYFVGIPTILKKGRRSMAATDVVNLRISADQKAIIDRAATLLGKNRTTFILENAVRSAEECLMERAQFWLSPEKWEVFVKALNAPVEPNPGLERLLATPAPWDKQEDGPGTTSKR